MANHKSSLKRIRQTKTKTLRNRVQAKSMRNALKDVRAIKDKKEAEGKLPQLFSMLDRLAKKNLIHKNKAANLKSEMALHINKL